MNMTETTKRAKRRIIRCMLFQSLMICLGWFSLHYGWGLTPKSWPFLLAYLLVMSVMNPVFVALMHIGVDESDK